MLCMYICIDKILFLYFKYIVIQINFLNPNQASACKDNLIIQRIFAKIKKLLNK